MTSHNEKCMPKRIILVRHGESQGNRDGTAYTTTPDYKIPLTPLGIQQSKSAGENIRRVVSDNDRQFNWKVYFYVSPYERTRATLREIGKSFCRKSVIGGREEVRIREQDFGNFQESERMKAIKKTRMRYGRFFYRFPEGESAADVFDRVSGFLESLWRDIDMNRLHHNPSDDLNLIIVSHGLASRVFLMRWFKWTVEQFEYLNNPGNAEFRVMQLGRGGDYSLAIHHTEEEMAEWGFSPEMIANQQFRAHACRDTLNYKSSWYLNSFFDQSGWNSRVKIEEERLKREAINGPDKEVDNKPDEDDLENRANEENPENRPDKEVGNRAEENIENKPGGEVLENGPDEEFKNTPCQEDLENKADDEDLQNKPDEDEDLQNKPGEENPENRPDEEVGNRAGEENIENKPGEEVLENGPDEEFKNTPDEEDLENKADDEDLQNKLDEAILENRPGGEVENRPDDKDPGNRKGEEDLENKPGEEVLENGPNEELDNTPDKEDLENKEDEQDLEKDPEEKVEELENRPDEELENRPDENVEKLENRMDGELKYNTNE